MFAKITQIPLTSALTLTLLVACGGGDTGTSEGYRGAGGATSAADGTESIAGGAEGRGLIDDPCTSTADCAATPAECFDIYEDGQNRCEGNCTENAQCGPQAVCYFGGEAAGECFRTCVTPADCSDDSFECVYAGPEFEGNVCLPRCRLWDCTATSYTYNCASSGYTAETNYGYGSPKTMDTKVTYANGHVVQCSAQSSGNGWSGSCQDDTGAQCTF